jgi:hypothetical protein
MVLRRRQKLELIEDEIGAPAGARALSGSHSPKDAGRGKAYISCVDWRIELIQRDCDVD